MYFPASLRCIFGSISVRVVGTTTPDDVVHLNSVFTLVVALHTTERYLPSTTDVAICDDVLNVGLSRSKNEDLHNHHIVSLMMFCVSNGMKLNITYFAFMRKSQIEEY